MDDFHVIIHPSQRKIFSFIVSIKLFEYHEKVFFSLSILGHYCFFILPYLLLMKLIII
jgi:hypothetical protein